MRSMPSSSMINYKIVEGVMLNEEEGVVQSSERLSKEYTNF